MITKLQILKHDNGGARIGVEIKDMVKNLKWVTDLNYSAGELTFDIVTDKDPIMPAMGAIVDFAWDNKDIFWGFVFSAEYTSDTTVSVKAYDFERYLLNLTGRQNIKDVPDVIRKNQEMCHIVYKRDAKKLKASRIVEYIDYFLSRSDLKREIEECFASFDLEKLVFQVY